MNSYGLSCGSPLLDSLLSRGIRRGEISLFFPARRAHPELRMGLMQSKKLTVEERVVVGKDRLWDDILSFVEDHPGGYLAMSKEERDRFRRALRLMSLPDDARITLNALRPNYINGEEYLYYSRRG
jgi:hypothetical protein